MIFKRTKKTDSILPGFKLSFIIGALALAIFVVLPLVYMLASIVQAGRANFAAVLLSDHGLAAIRLTFFAAFCAALLASCFGILIAWILHRYKFFGRRFIDACIDIPFALPASVSGLTIAFLYDNNGYMGKLLSHFGITVAYTPAGIIIAMLFTALPFGVRFVQPVLEKIPNENFEVAQTLGAKPWRIFVTQVLAPCAPAIFGGFALAMARSLGEFGVLQFISGNIPFKTEVLSLLLAVYLDEYDYTSASILASFTLSASLILLCIGLLSQRRVNKYFARGN